MLAKNYGDTDIYTHVQVHTYMFILYFEDEDVIGCYIVFTTKIIFCLPEGLWVFLDFSLIL